MDVAAAFAATVEEAFNRVRRERMQDLPMLNPALSVEAVGARDWGDRWLTALVTPWSISLLMLSGTSLAGEEAPGVGAARQYDFPAGRFEFVGAAEDGIGSFEMCSLFSPVVQFVSQDVARAAAMAALERLLTPHGEADRPAEPGQGRRGSPMPETHAAPAPRKTAAVELSRRDLFRGVFGRDGSGSS